MRTKRRKSPQKIAPIPARTAAVAPVLAATPVDDWSTPLLKVAEVARALRVSERTVYTYIDNGMLERVKIGGQTLHITSASLKQLMTP